MQGTKNKTLCSIMVGAGGKDSLKEATQKSTGFRMEKLKLSIEVTIQESKMKELHTSAQVFLKNMLLNNRKKHIVRQDWKNLISIITKTGKPKQHMVCGTTINKSKVVIPREIQDRGYLQDGERLSYPLRNA